MDFRWKIAFAKKDKEIETLEEQITKLLQQNSVKDISLIETVNKLESTRTNLIKAREEFETLIDNVNQKIVNVENDLDKITDLLISLQ